MRCQQNIVVNVDHKFVIMGIVPNAIHARIATEEIGTINFMDMTTKAMTHQREGDAG